MTNEYSVDTPEQVQIYFPLAGLGSRFLALLLDTAIQIFVNIVVVLVITFALSAGIKTTHIDTLSNTAQKWFAAGIILLYFLLYWGYYTLFEAFWNGQTPGKRALKIRVVKESGRQITFFESLARNLVRVVDALPGMYLIGVISILVTRSNKRLGDLVADTIVVHERADDFYTSLPATPEFLFASKTRVPTVPATAHIPHDRIARLTAADLSMIDSYLARTLSLPIETRANLASRLLDTLCVKMDVPVPTEAPPERTLEAIAFTMRATGRR